MAEEAEIAGRSLAGVATEELTPRREAGEEFEIA
jgi:hypothetical protein